jgi:SAM-dependent methyltransferase
MSTDVDFGRTADDYARFRAGLPEAFFERVFNEGWLQPDASLVDLGTGTGTLARGFARRGCRVIGIDPAAPMLAQARLLGQQAGVQIDYRVASAEDTGLESASLDAVTAGQCWHWFVRERAAVEALRILKPGGALIIAHFDWIPLPGNVVELTERLIEQHNPGWKLGGGTGMYPQWLADLAKAGFIHIRTFSFDTLVPYSQEAWRGRIRASAGVGASLASGAVTRFDSDLARALSERFPDAPLQVPHRVFAVVGSKPASS